MALSATDLARLLSPRHTVDAYLNRWPLNPVATADINQVSITYPVASLTVDNTSADWLTIVKKGQMVRVVNSVGTHVTTGIVRKAPASTTLYIDAKAQGDPGRAQLQALALGDDHVITIYDYMPPWTMFSRIAAGVFYKEFDWDFDNQGDYPQPVCNMGAWRQAFVGTDDKATLTFDASASYDWVAESLTYLWELPASGATLTSGTLSSSSIGVEFDPGFYLMACTVSNGTTTRRGVRPVWINETAGSNAPFSTLNDLVLTSDRQDLQGRQLNLDVYGNQLESVFMDGGAVLLSDYGLYNGEPLSSGSGYVNAYAGFITSLTRSGTFSTNKLSVETTSLYKLMEIIACPPQAIRESATPANWTEVVTNLATPSFVVWYLIHYHCYNALSLFDYHKLPDATPVRKTKWNTLSANLGAQVAEVATSVSGNVGSASDGSIYFLRNPGVESAVFREALDTRLTLTEDHIKERIAYPQTYRPRVGEYTAYGFHMDGSDVAALKSIAGDGAQGQGTDKPQGPGLLVIDQDELNDKAGHLMALDNSPTPDLPLPLSRNLDVFDPARDWNTWFALNIDAAYDPRGVGFAGNALALAVDREWRQLKGSLTKHLNVTVRPETAGLPGTTIALNSWSGAGQDGVLWGYDVFDSYVLDFQVDEFGNLEWKPSNGSDWNDLGDVTGDTGEQGDCVDCDTVETPDPVDPGDRPGGEDWPCLSAANIADYVDYFAEELASAIDSSTSKVQFRQTMGAALVVVMSPSLAYNDYLTDLTEDYYGTTASDISTAFDDTFRDQLRDEIY